MANDLWRWADPNGQQRKVRLDELRASLAAGIIAPNAPVWHAGWSGWRHAHEVPELTSASVGGANGVVLNIPPPPLAMVAVQQQYEAAGDSLVPTPRSGETEEEPPPPPAYVAIQGKTPSIAPSSGHVKTQMGGSAFQPGGKPPPSSRPLGFAKHSVAIATQLGVAPPTSDAIILLESGSVEELSTSSLMDAASSPELGNPATNRISTDGLGMPAPTVPIILTPGEAMDASLLGLPRKSPLQPIFDDLAAVRRGEKPRNRNTLIVVGIVGLMLVVLVVAAVVSLFSGPDKPAKIATSASASAKPSKPSKLVASAAPPPPPVATAVEIPPPPPPETQPAETGAVFTECATAGEDRPISAKAIVSSGVDAQAIDGKLDLGFAASAHDGIALALDPGSFSVVTTAHTKPAGDIRRVTPMLVNGRLVPMPDAEKRGDHLGIRRVAATTPLVDVGVVDGKVAWAPHGKDSSAVLYPLEGDTAIEALRVVAIDKGLVLAFRRGNAIHVGAAKGEGALDPWGDLSRITGLGQTGSPALAVSGDQVVVAWADRTDANAEWVVRWARAKIGALIESSTAKTLAPEGGLGGPIMSPALASLGGGRFLVAWSEGPISSHQVRAATIDAEGAMSAPIAISGAGSNAGQPAAVVGPDGRGVVAFLAAKGKGFELHATPLHCK